MRKIRAMSLGSVFVLLCLLATGCAASGGDDPLAEGTGGEAEEGGGEAVKVGAFNFGESLVLAEVYKGALEGAGVQTEDVTQLDSREATFPALESGELDMLPEYTGAAVTYLDEASADITDTTEQSEVLADELPQGLVALEPSPAEDRDVLVVTSETAQQYDLETVSDLQPVAGELTVAGPPEMEERANGLPGYERVYDITFGDFLTTDAGGPTTIAALEEGRAQVARLFSTNPVIEQNDWVVLEEDKPLTPPQNIVPIVRSDVVSEEGQQALDEVSAALTTETLVEFNRRYDVEREDAAAIAGDFLAEHGIGS